MSKSELELKMMGKIASAKYLSDNVPMDDTIVDMVKESRLNPHHVARICETANVSTYDELFKKHASGKFTFEHANQDKIAEKVNESPSMPFNENNADIKHISELLPPVESVDTEEDLKKAAEYTKIANYAKSLEPKMDEARVRKLRSKLAMYVRELDSAIFEATLMKKEAEETLIQTMKTAALQGENIADIYIAARALFPAKEAAIKEFFGKASERLSKHNISFKTAAATYTEDSQGSQADKAINKNHPIIKHLDTVLNTDDNIIGGCNKTKDYVVSKIEVLDEALLNKKFKNSEI